MSDKSPFAILQDFDQRCRENSPGLPKGEVVEDDWIGIGFGLNGKKLVARMETVTEILPVPKTIRVPGVQPWVKGIANIRGTLLPVLDMGGYLNGVLSVMGNANRILVVNTHNVMAGLIVEEVFGMRRFKPELKVDSNLSEMGELEPYLDGMFNDSNGQWNVFSVEKLVDHERFLKVV